jgi:hypothetical protein
MTCAVRMWCRAVVMAGLCVMVLAPGATGSAAANHGLARPDRVASSSDSLFAVAAVGRSDAWAVGVRGVPGGGTDLTLTEHWDGQSWKVVPSPSPAGTGGISFLSAAAFDSPHDGWAVGTIEPVSAPQKYGLIEHWNGVRWTALPRPSSVTNELTGVAAISATAAWAVGFGTAADGRQVSVFMRWNGTRWRYLPSPAVYGSLAVISGRDIWAVGSTLGTRPGQKVRNEAERWNGSKWTIVPVPTRFRSRTPNIVLEAAGGSSSSNVWAVGSYWSGTALSGDSSPLIEHWDGTHWRLQPCPDPFPPRDGVFLTAIAALSRTSAFAVGTGFGPRGAIPIIERWNGVRWTAMPSRFQPGVTNPETTAVAAVNPRYAWVAGTAQDNGPGMINDITLIEKWNGISWQQVPSPNPWTASARALSHDMPTS